MPDDHPSGLSTGLGVRTRNLYGGQQMELPRDLLPLVEILVGRLELTPVDVAREGGVDLEEARRLWRALGFPPVPDGAPVFTRADVDVLALVRRLLDRNQVEPAAVLQLARLMGRSLARVADAQIDAAGAVLGEAIEALAPFATDLERLLVYVWRRHLLAALLRRAVRPSSDAPVAVGFADLVGFTALSQGLEAPDLATMVDRFETIAYEHVPARGGRVIKMIGDEVMFAVDDGAVAAEIALALVEAYQSAPDVPAVRVGLARGPVLALDGDLFGPTVNLASRLVNVARPNSVLASDALGAELEGAPGLVLRHLRPMPLQGIGRVRTWVVRRAVEAPAVESPEPTRRGRRARA